MEQEKQQGWFQQDGTAAHTARVSMAAVGDVFGDRVISLGLWPPRSPDLIPPDFYLWGELKGSVYADNARTTNELKQKVTSAFQNIKPDELECVVQKHVASRSFMSAGEWRAPSTVIVDNILLHESILNHTSDDNVY